MRHPFWFCWLVACLALATGSVSAAEVLPGQISLELSDSVLAALQVAPHLDPVTGCPTGSGGSGAVDQKDPCVWIDDGFVPGGVPAKGSLQLWLPQGFSIEPGLVVEAPVVVQGLTWASVEALETPCGLWTLEVGLAEGEQPTSDLYFVAPAAASEATEGRLTGTLRARLAVTYTQVETEEVIERETDLELVLGGAWELASHKGHCPGGSNVHTSLCAFDPDSCAVLCAEEVAEFAPPLRVGPATRVLPLDQP